MKATRFSHHPVVIGKRGTTLERTIVCRNAEDLANLDQQILVQSAIQLYALGTRLVVGDRVYRYAHIKSNATGLGRGRICVCTDAGIERGSSLGAQVAGAVTVTWTVIGTSIAEDQFAEGYLLCQGGFVHKIRKNTAALQSADSTLTLYEPFAACEAIGAGRYGILLENPYANVGFYTQYGAGMPMGALLIDPTQDYYVWLQTWGPCGVIATPATMGDIMIEHCLALGTVPPASPQEEIKVKGGDGLPIVGRIFMGGGGIDWDSENFIFIWLTINP